MANGLSTGLTRAEGRQFGLTLGIAFGLLAAFMWWRGHEPLMTGAGVLALLFLVAGLLIPRQLGPVQKAWMRFGLMLSRVTTPIILGILYLLIITPIGVAMRLAGRNPVAHRAVNNSYWVQRPPARGSSAMERQF